VRTTCHSPFSYYFRTINGILQDLTSFDLNFSIPEYSIIIPGIISSMLFQRLETVISMLLGLVRIKITANSEIAQIRRFMIESLNRKIRCFGKNSSILVYNAGSDSLL